MGNVEVDDLEFAVFIDEHILGFDVAMDDVVFVHWIGAEILNEMASTICWK
jgi:hypothetical protein